MRAVCMSVSVRVRSYLSQLGYCENDIGQSYCIATA